MSRRRFTITDLREGIANINEWLADAGAMVRFNEQGRNGYQAVDEYPVDEHGEWIGNGCINRTIQCGTSRECYDAAYTAYQHIVRDLQVKRHNAKAAALEDILDGQSASDLRGFTGLSMERCEEIIRLVR